MKTIKVHYIPESLFYSRYMMWKCLKDKTTYFSDWKLVPHYKPTFVTGYFWNEQ